MVFSHRQPPPRHKSLPRNHQARRHHSRRPDSRPKRRAHKRRRGPCQLNFLQFNCRSFRLQKTHVADIARAERIDVMLLSETHHPTTGHLPQGFRVVAESELARAVPGAPQQTVSVKGRGTCVIVHHLLQAESIQPAPELLPALPSGIPRNRGAEVIWALVYDGSMRNKRLCTAVCSVYIPPNLPVNYKRSVAHYIFDAQVPWLRQRGVTRIVIGGDFNRVNERDDFNDHVTAAGLTCANVAGVTTRHQKNSPPAILDFTYVSTDTQLQDWRARVDQPTSSDHRMITFHTKTTGPPADRTAVPPVRFHGVPDEHMQRAMHQEMTCLVNNWRRRYGSSVSDLGVFRMCDHPVARRQQIVQEMVNEFEATVDAVARAHLHVSQPRSRGPHSMQVEHWWTPELTRMRKELGALRVHARRSLGDKTNYATLLYWYNFAKKEAREAMYARDAADLNDHQRLWHGWRRAKQRRKQGGGTANVDEVVKQIDYQPTAAARGPFVPASQLAHTISASADAAEEDQHDWNRVFAVTDIEDRMLRMSAHTAPGAAGLMPMWMKATFGAKPVARALTWITNSIFTLVAWPDSFRDILVKPIAKPGRPGQFRPIAVARVVARCVDGCMADRVQIWCETERVLPPSQFAFRRNHSTANVMEVLHMLLSSAKERGMISAIMALDVAKAYDSVDRRVVMRALNDKKLDGRLMGAMSVMMRSSPRYRVTTMGGYTSSSVYERTLGLLQGSSCSPILWCIVMGSVLEADPPRGHAQYMFADDLTVHTAGYSLNDLVANLNVAGQQIAQCCSNGGLDVLASKSEVMMPIKPQARQTAEWRALVRDGKIASTRIHINGNVPKSAGEVMRLLGFWYDRRFNFDEHVKRQKNAALGALARLQRMDNVSNMSWLARRDLVRAAVLSHLEYGLPFIGSLDKKHIKTLEKVQRRALHFILDASVPHTSWREDGTYLWSAPGLQELCAITGVLPLELRFEKLRARMVAQRVRLNPEQHLLAIDRIRVYMATLMPDSILANRAVTAGVEPIDPAQPFSADTPPAMVLPVVLKNRVQQMIRTASDDPSIYNALVERMFNTAHNNIVAVVATSMPPNRPTVSSARQPVGMAVVRGAGVASCKKVQVRLSQHNANSEVSIMAAVMAIIITSKDAMVSANGGGHMTIFTRDQSLVYALSAVPTKQWTSRCAKELRVALLALRKSNIQLRVCWLPKQEQGDLPVMVWIKKETARLWKNNVVLPKYLDVETAAADLQQWSTFFTADLQRPTLNVVRRRQEINQAVQEHWQEQWTTSSQPTNHATSSQHTTGCCVPVVSEKRKDQARLWSLPNRTRANQLLTLLRLNGICRWPATHEYNGVLRTIRSLPTIPQTCPACHVANTTEHIVCQCRLFRYVRVQWYGHLRHLDTDQVLRKLLGRIPDGKKEDPNHPSRIAIVNLLTAVLRYYLQPNQVQGMSNLVVSAQPRTYPN